MTALAPGLDAPKTDGSCFNCGSHDHFAYTCPEPVRKEPHGAAVFRQRQADKTLHRGGGRGSDTSRPKSASIVVTKYAPPPPPFPPPPFYPPPPPANAWDQGGAYPPAPAPGPSSNVYGQQPPHPYPPPTQAQAPYQPLYPPVNTGYAPPPLPPIPHINGGYGPPAPSSAPPYAQYGQYGQNPYQPPPPPPPPPPSYAPPTSYAPPAYPPSYAPPDRAYPQTPPQQLGYQGSPAPGYQVPPPSGYHGPHSLAYQAAPGPTPPPSTTFASGYGVPPGLPPPPGTFPPPAPYAPGLQLPAPYTTHNPPPKPNWVKDSGSHNNQRRDRRDRRNDRDRGNKSKQHRRDNNNNQRGRHHREDAPSRRPPSMPREKSPRHSPAPTDVKIDTPELVEATKAEDEKTEVSEPVGDSASKEDEFDQDELWDFEKAFMELATRPADPVGQPLAAEWNDVPTIPPAYNAKCIKSEYYDPDNPDAFLASVRDTKHWPALKRDPVFRFRRGMIAVQFPGSHHEYFTYHCSKRMGANELKEREILALPSDETLMDSTKVHYNAASIAHRHSDFPSISLNGKRNHSETDDYSRDVKRPRNKELDRSPIPRQARRSSPRDAQADAGSPYRPQSRDEYSRSPGGYRLQANGRLVPYDVAPSLRNDSGYHSSSDRYRSGRDDRSNTHLSPRDASRERDRDWDRAREWARDCGRRNRGRSPSLAKTRTRSPSRSRSRSRSRTAAADSAAADSVDEMDDLEYELLGMQRPETPEKKVVCKPVSRKPRVKVNDAFSRRW